MLQFIALKVGYRALNTFVLTEQCLVFDIIKLVLRSFVVAAGSEINPLVTNVIYIWSTHS